MKHLVNQHSRAQMEVTTLLEGGQRRVRWMGGVVCVLALALAVQSLTVRSLVANQGFVPWVVEVNGFGQVRSFGAAERVVDEDRLITLHLRQFVQSLRTVARDEGMKKTLFFDTMRFVAASRHLDADDLYKDPHRLQGLWSRAVLVRTVLRQSDGVWEVTWMEDVIEKSRVERSEWRGLFTVSIEEVKDPGSMALNPFGFTVKDWSLQQSSESQQFALADDAPL